MALLPLDETVLLQVLQQSITDCQVTVGNIRELQLGIGACRAGCNGYTDDGPLGAKAAEEEALCKRQECCEDILPSESIPSRLSMIVLLYFAVLDLFKDDFLV